MYCFIIFCSHKYPSQRGKWLRLEENLAKIVKQYSNGNFVEMMPGTVVLDYALSSYWSVLSNDGKTVRLKNLKGGENAAEISVSDETTHNTFVLLDVTKEFNRYETLIIFALEWAINVSEQVTCDLIRAMGITSDELSAIGYDEDNFLKMHGYSKEVSA